MSIGETRTQQAGGDRCQQCFNDELLSYNLQNEWYGSTRLREINPLIVGQLIDSLISEPSIVIEPEAGFRNSKSVITTEKWEQLRERMAALAITEEDLDERFVLGSGSGGQKINKTASCVQLRHGPTGIEIRCQRDRSQAANRYFARRELCEQVEEQVRGEKSRRRQAQEKIRRQKRRRSRRAKARMLEEKRKTAEKKDRRRPVGED